MCKVVVIGGGVSGISAAHYLNERGANTVLLEKSSTLGGRVGLAKLGNKNIELGGKNIGKRYSFFRRFASTFGYDDYEYFGLNSSRLKDGKIVTIDNKKKLSLIKSLAKTHSISDLLRFSRYLFGVLKKDRGFLDSSYFNDVAKKFDHGKISDVFGDKFCNDILRPMVVRMNGAEPEETYIGNLGSNLRMLRDSYEQLNDGMGGLLNEISQHSQVILDSDVTQLYTKNNKITGLRIKSPDGKETDMECDAIVLALPAKYAAKLLDNCAPEISEVLSTVAYYPVGVAVAEYSHDIFTNKVRALVFEPSSALSNAGAYGINDLNIVRYTFSGKSARGYLDDPMCFDTLLDLGEKTLNKHFPVNRENRLNYTTRIFNSGLCAYTKNQHEFLKNIKKGMSTLQGLHLTGDYIMGASIEACFRSSYKTVQNMAI